MKRLKSVGAVLAGLTVMVALVILGTVVAAVALGGPEGEPTAGYLVANLALSGVAAAVGAALTVRLAPDRPWLHVGAMALFMIVLSAPNLRGGPDRPAFYPLMVLVVGLVGLAVGGYLMERHAGGSAAVRRERA